MTVQFDGLAVRWLGYSTVRIETPQGLVIYLDPGRYGTLDGTWRGPDAHPPAVDYHARDGDLVCVTHDHHYDSDAIERVASEDATLVVHEAVDAAGIDRDVAPVEDLPYDVRRVDDETHLRLDLLADTADADAAAGGDPGTVDLFTVAAYNDPDGPRDAHAPGEGCGFRLSVDGTSVFWPGDSDVLEGHAALDVDLFLANIAGAVVMDRHEAAALAADLDPGLVLPVHYNTIDLLAADSREFAADVAASGVPVVLDEGPD